MLTPQSHRAESIHSPRHQSVTTLPGPTKLHARKSPRGENRPSRRQATRLIASTYSFNQIWPATSRDFATRLDITAPAQAWSDCSRHSGQTLAHQKRPPSTFYFHILAAFHTSRARTKITIATKTSHTLVARRSAPSCSIPSSSFFHFPRIQAAAGTSLSARHCCAVDGQAHASTDQTHSQGGT